MSAGSKDFQLYRFTVYIAVSRNFVRCDHNGSTALYYLLTADDSTVDSIRFIQCIVVSSEKKFSPNPAPVVARFQFLNPARSVCCAVSVY